MNEAKPGPFPNQCSATGWPQIWSCKHGHAFTVACLAPTDDYVPMCCREDRVFDGSRQVVTIARTVSDPTPSLQTKQGTE